MLIQPMARVNRRAATSASVNWVVSYAWRHCEDAGGGAAGVEHSQPRLTARRR